MSSNEHVTETTRIISEDEVPPEILAEIRRKEKSHADTVTKIVNVTGTVDSPNVGALMSAMRPKVDKPTLEQRGTSLAEKLVNIGRTAKAQSDARIREKSKTLADSVLRGVK